MMKRLNPANIGAKHRNKYRQEAKHTPGFLFIFVKLKAISKIIAIFAHSIEQNI